MRQTKTAAVIMLLFFANFCRGQSWQLVEDLDGFITDIEIINGQRYTTFKTGELLLGDSIIKVFPVQQYQETGLLSVCYYQDSICVMASGVDSIQRVICGRDTLLAVSYKTPWAIRHRGGDMVAVDSVLLVSFGYGTDPDDSQDTSTFRGKIIAVTSDTAYIYAYGLRNGWKIDTIGDTLHISDVGAQQEEEITWIDTAGLNLGWPCYEGYIQHDTTCTDVYFPYFTYPRSLTGNAIIGGKYFRSAYWWCDNYYRFGGKSYENGWWDKIPCPQYPDGMYVQGDSIFVYDYTGKIYMWVEGPLSIDTIPEEEDPVLPPSLVITSEEVRWTEDLNGTLLVLTLDNKIVSYEEAYFDGFISIKDFLPGMYVLCLITPHGVQWSKLFPVVR